MRVLTYKVKGQRLSATGNHSGLIAGTKGYLKAQFEFDDEWNGCEKVAQFFKEDDEHATRLDTNDSCEIPPEVLTDQSFEIAVEGRRKDGFRIISNSIKERQLRR